MDLKILLNQLRVLYRLKYTDLRYIPLILHGTAMYFGDIKYHTRLSWTDVDYGSLLTEYGCEANTDNVSLVQSHLH
ncbi:BGP_1a_G0004780.mRNA.1.CDS.1 [Saccharomyces cerevisiae]|nr:BGP_1a_G0004780.mRNA.1.CDS.1 [Saccharomyces cerevisiae]CAI7051856.1 BGP_1a_G0004780.mRNA.1.CDS.1 [Saccharomyces cerevisiae]